METLLNTPWWVALPLIGFAAFWCLIAFAGAQAVAGIGKAYLHPMEEPDSSAVVRMVLEAGFVDSLWLEQNDFAPQGVYHVVGLQGTPAMVAWAKDNGRTYLCLYRLPNGVVSFDFVTTLDNDGYLTTGNLRDGQLLPTPPGSWNQTFTSSDAVMQWPRHTQALMRLEQNHNTRPARGESQLESDFTTCLKQQHANLMSIPLWQARIPYWFFVRRATRHGKPVE